MEPSVLDGVLCCSESHPARDGGQRCGYEMPDKHRSPRLAALVFRIYHNLTSYGEGMFQI